MKKQILFRYLLLLLSYISWSPFFMYHDNNLLNNGNWDSEKLKMDELMGAQAFVVNPQTLASRSLNLAEAHGFNRVVTKEPFRGLEKAEFQLRFPDQGYLYFLFNFSDDDFLALRFDPDASFVSFHKASREGKFLSSQDISIPNQMSLDVWHRAEIHFDDTRLGVSVNKSEIVWFDVDLHEFQRIGFQGGFHPVFVDSVKLLDRTGSIIFRDTFDSAYSLRNIPAVPLAVLVSFFLIELFLFPVFRFSHFFASTINIVAISILLSGIIASAWYLPVLASKHIFLNYHEVFNVTEFQKRRKKLVFSGLDEKLSMKREKSRKILFIGSSQTEGAGAYSPDESFVSQVESFLNSSGDPFAYQCYSLGISAYSLRGILDEYELLLSRFVPEASFLNIAHNDEVYASLDEYSEQLQRFLLLNERYGVSSVFIKEAVSSEFMEEGLRAHAIIDEVAELHGVPVIDTHSFLRDKEGSGFIWWDQVHPTSYGHALIAEKIHDFMLRHDFL